MIKILTKIFRAKTDYKYRIINIYVDKNDKLTFIPTGTSKKWNAITDLSDLCIELVPPYTNTDIENKLYDAMKLCFSYEPVDVSYNTLSDKAKASKAYNKQVKGKRLISIKWLKDEGYIISPYKKAKDRGYEAIMEKNILVGTLPTTGVLAKAFYEALKVTEPY
jgi:hypothetical protein